MNNKTIRLLTLCLLLSVGVGAQSITDGLKALYSGKFEAATKIFEGKQNTPEGAYWLAQTYFAKDHDDSAAYIVNKGLAAVPNAPLLLAAKGQLQLMENKPNEAKQSFESAITASRGKKNDDPAILNAVGKAITKVFNNVAKVGDINYAVQKLESAKNIATSAKSKDNWLIADIYTTLGDAYRLARPGEGSAAFDAYQSALVSDPSFAQAQYRKALIFKSQRNKDLYLETLDKAIAADPGFLPAYDQQYWYYMGTQDHNKAQAIAAKIKQLTPGDPNNEIFSSWSYYFGKKYDDAIRSAKNIIANANEHTNPKVYKLIAYSLLEKKDTAAAIPYVEDYFKREKKEELVPPDYTLRAAAYSTTPGKEAEVMSGYMDGVKADTVLDNKIDILENGAKFFAERGKYGLQGDLLSKIAEIKKRPIVNDFWYAANAYYKAKQYDKAWKNFDVMRTKYNNMYGYLMTFKSSSVFDSTNSQNILVPDAEKLIAFSKTDTSQYAKSNTFDAAFSLARYYNDVAKDKAKAIEYLMMSKDYIDDMGAKQQIQSNIDALQRSGSSGGAKPAPKPTPKPKPKGGK